MPAIIYQPLKTHQSRSVSREAHPLSLLEACTQTMDSNNFSSPIIQQCEHQSKRLPLQPNVPQLQCKKQTKSFLFIATATPVQFGSVILIEKRRLKAPRAHACM